MRSVETFRLRVKLLNLQGRIEAKYMEIRWLGEVELGRTHHDPKWLVLPFPCPYIHGEKLLPCHCPEWLATVKLGIDLGEVFSKAPEQAKFISRDEDRDIVPPLSTLSPSHAQSEEANSLAGRFPSRMGSVETFRLRVKLLNL